MHPAAFGLTVIEAMTCGLPTFATNHGGPSEIIKHKKSGGRGLPGLGRLSMAAWDCLVGVPHRDGAKVLDSSRSGSLHAW